MSDLLTLFPEVESDESKFALVQQVNPVRSGVIGMSMAVGVILALVGVLAGGYQILAQPSTMNAQAMMAAESADAANSKAENAPQIESTVAAEFITSFYRELVADPVGTCNRRFTDDAVAAKRVPPVSACIDYFTANKNITVAQVITAPNSSDTYQVTLNIREGNKAPQKLIRMVTLACDETCSATALRVDGIVVVEPPTPVAPAKQATSA